MAVAQKNMEGAMASIQEVWRGGEPPVKVHAENCHTVNVSVQIFIEARVHDSLRKWAEDIEQGERIET